MNLITYASIRAEESGGKPFTETGTVNFASANVFVMCYLNQVNQQGSNGQAQVFITSYVQSGTPHSGSWQTLDLNNVTSVTFSLTVTNTNAQSMALIFAT